MYQKSGKYPIEKYRWPDVLVSDRSTWEVETKDQENKAILISLRYLRLAWAILNLISEKKKKHRIKNLTMRVNLFSVLIFLLNYPLSKNFNIWTNVFKTRFIINISYLTYQTAMPKNSTFEVKFLLQNK